MRDYLLGHPPVKEADLTVESNFSRPLHSIIWQVAEKHGLSFSDLLSKRRFRPLAWARQEAMWRCANETPSSLPEIGRALGKRDHTTVIHGIRRHEERMRAHGAA